MTPIYTFIWISSEARIIIVNCFWNTLSSSLALPAFTTQQQLKIHHSQWKRNKTRYLMLRLMSAAYIWPHRGAFYLFRSPEQETLLVCSVTSNQRETMCLRRVALLNRECVQLAVVPLSLSLSLSCSLLRGRRRSMNLLLLFTSQTASRLMLV